MTTTEGLADQHVTDLLPEWVNGSLDAARAAQVAEHVADCAICRAEADEWRHIAYAVNLAAPTIPAATALIGLVLQDVDDTHQGQGLRLVAASGRRHFWQRPVAQLTAAAAVVFGLSAAVVFTPVGSYAQGLITIFQPKQFVAVPVTLEELAALPALERYGTLVQPTREQPTRVASAAEAAARSRLTVPVPGTLPAGFPSNPTFYVADGKTASFTFSAAKAAAGSASLPPMPATIDGSQIVVNTNPVVVVTYQDGSAEDLNARDALSTVPSRGKKVLIVGRTTVPGVRSSGATIEQLQQYLLGQPGVSPDLARAIRSIGDPSTTLPIPIPVDKALSHPITVQGASGLAVGDSTGIGGGIVWQREGIITGVAGTFSESQLLAVANSIK